MRIGMIAPLEMRVPPIAYGGTELIVSLLTEELVRRGHDVTLFASGDSITAARLVPGAPHHLRSSGQDGSVLSMLNVVNCLERARDFDVIHNHTCIEGLATGGLVGTPMLTTLHGGMQGDYLDLLGRYRGWFNTISHSATRLLPPFDHHAGVVYNAIDYASYPFNPGPRDDFLLFLSRISAEKGPDSAIEVARKLGRRLVIAGNVHPVDEAFFHSKVEPFIDGDQVVYVGEADYEMKRKLFSTAACMLAPIAWEEPFGLFMAESLACGTPVVAFRRGAAPEVVVDGETGFIVDDIDSMAEAVGRVAGIDPYVCRRNVEERFSVGRMTDDYLAIYTRILAGRTLGDAMRNGAAVGLPLAGGMTVLNNPFGGAREEEITDGALAEQDPG